MTKTVSRTHRAASQYLERGWCAIPVPARSKNPNRPGWQQERYEPADVERAFDPNGNIGVHCGEPSNGLVDVDLDCPEAVALAALFLPDTGRRSGRASKPASHWWYVCDPIPEKTERYKDGDGVTILELRSTGGQTIVPPSLHDETGEEYVWEARDEAGEIDGRLLRHHAQRLAACAILARHWREGSRHDLALAVAGTLLRHGWQAEEAWEFVAAASRAAGDLTQLSEHRQAVFDTLDSLDRDEPATGIPTLVELLGEGAARRFLDWLGIGARQQAFTEIHTNGKHEPEAEEAAEYEPVMEPAWEMPPAAPAIDVDELPYWLNRVVRHVTPFTPMFPDDWPVMVALPFWSMLWPRTRIQNLNLALWTLGIGAQGSGKNVATDELLRLFRAITQHEITLYTAGSPEGLWEALEGVGRQVLAYHDEYAGLLKLFSRDHMSHAKEALCSLYDGRGVGYLRSKGKSVRIEEPVLGVVATTTPGALRQWSTLSDMTDGYLSRYLFCAPDQRNVSPDFYPMAHNPEREQFARELLDFRNSMRGVLRVNYAETGRKDPPQINAYREHLGMDTGETIRLEDAMHDRGVPPGRLLARVKKVAALLALAEAQPSRTDSGQTALIESQHISLAITIVERGYFYAVRALAWIGESGEVQLSNRILDLLLREARPFTKRDLCQRLHERAADVATALDLLERSGQVLRDRPPQSNRGGRLELWHAVKLHAAQ